MMILAEYYTGGKWSGSVKLGRMRHGLNCDSCGPMRSVSRHVGIAGGSWHCRSPMAKCRLAVSSKAIWQLEIDNWQYNRPTPLPRHVGILTSRGPLVVLCGSIQN